MMIRKSLLVALALVAFLGLIAPVQAGDRDNMWGPRLGVSIDPAVVMAGVHLDFGPVAPDFHLRGLVEGGIGDEKMHLALGLQGLRFFDPNSKGWRPYLGGEVGVNYLNRDLDDKTVVVYPDPENDPDGKKTTISPDRTTSGMALNLVGGFEGDLSAGRKWFVELRAGLLEGPHGKLVLGWLF